MSQPQTFNDGSDTDPTSSSSGGAGWVPGDVKIHHSYNGAAPIDKGWMLCDGRQINQTNYETEHGAGSWTSDGVSSTALANLYLPNMVARYPVGASSTTASGSSAIPTVGNAGNTAALGHSHTVSSHNHEIYNGTTGATFNSSGTSFSQSGTKTNGIAHASTTVNTGIAQDMWTSNVSPGTDTQLGSTSIQPDSIQVLYYMRII